jgi:hypothetical protein
MAKIKKIKRSSISVNSAHQKIEDHENYVGLCKWKLIKKLLN